MNRNPSYDPARKIWVGVTGPDEPFYANPMDRWVKNWENCAGKPYKKPGHATKPGKTNMTIKETARFWQDAMVRMSWGQTHQKWLDFLAWERPVQYPKSLGELCLELTPPKHKFWFDKNNVLWGGVVAYTTARDRLRRAMYHKHTSIQEEGLHKAHDYFVRLSDPFFTGKK